MGADIVDLDTRPNTGARHAMEFACMFDKQLTAGELRAIRR